MPFPSKFVKHNSFNNSWNNIPIELQNELIQFDNFILSYITFADDTNLMVNHWNQLLNQLQIEFR